MRQPLGEGWFLIIADVLLNLPADPEGRTAAGRRAWRAHNRALAAYFADPTANLVRLEGPAGIVATFPAEERLEAFAALGIEVRRKPRKRPGPAPTVSWRQIMEAIYRLEDDPAHRPTQEQAATALGIEERTLAHRHKGIPWREIVAAVLAYRPQLEKQQRLAEKQQRLAAFNRPGPVGDPTDQRMVTRSQRMKG